MTTLEQIKLNWPAIGVISGIVINVSGWFIVHFLTKRREAQKEKRTKDAAAAREIMALKAELHLTASEREILSMCVAVNGYERGHVWILRTSGFGPWVRAGKQDFADNLDVSVQARYLDAFESLLRRGYFRQEGDNYYQLTGFGFERATNEV